MEKLCKKCGAVREYKEGNEGKLVQCKICKKEYKKKYYAKNSDRLNKRKKRYRTEYPDKVHEYSKRYYAKNSDRLNKERIQYRIKNSEKERLQKVQYRTKNADKIKEYNQKISKELAKPYVVQQLRKQGFSTQVITQYPELIEVKRIQLQTIRIKQLTTQNHE